MDLRRYLMKFLVRLLLLRQVTTLLSFTTFSTHSTVLKYFFKDYFIAILPVRF